MIRAIAMVWRAKASRYGLVAGAVPIVVALVSMACFQQERLDGMKEGPNVFPLPLEPWPTAPALEAAPAFEKATLVTERLPTPPLHRLPGVMCHPHGDAGYGCSIAVHGQFVAVGAHSDDTAGLEEGAVHIYVRRLPELPELVPHSAETFSPWIYQARVLRDPHLKPAARTLHARQARFGRKVAMANGVLAVMQGQLYDHGPPEDNTDAVYVFGSDDGWDTWRQEARLKTPPGARGHGLAMAIFDSQTLLVGAPMAAAVSDNAPQGAVYVYHAYRDAGGQRRWAPLGELRAPPDAGPDARFGGCISTHGDLVAISMNSPGGGTVAESGRQWGVPIYRRTAASSPPGDWQFLGLVPAPAHATGDFGARVALDGPVLVVAQGGSLRDGSDVRRQPRVFVFRAPGPGMPSAEWKYETELPLPEGWELAKFGLALAVEGQWLVVGDYGAGIPGQSSGLAFVYRHDPGRGWILHRTLAPVDPARTRYFSTALAMVDGTIFLSAATHPVPYEVPGAVLLWAP